jgi:hypothetical protein
MLQLGELGSPECTHATRALVQAGDGAAADASPEQRDAYDHAAQIVLSACARA